VNLLSNTEQAFLNGYPVITPLNESISRRENFQFIEISTHNPFFGWVVPSATSNTTQTAYRILVASDNEFLLNDSSDLWDTGKVNSNQSFNILYNGEQLEPGKVYFWKVKIWDSHGDESDFSEISQFKTSGSLTDYATDRYPIQKQDDHAVRIDRIGKTRYFADFGKASFGRIRMNLYSETGTDTVTIHLGEAEKGGSVDRSPGGTIRYSQYAIRPEKGWNTYVVTIRPDKRNTGPQAVLMPEYIGEVTPFRYCEIENYSYPLQDKDLIRETAFYPFNDSDSHFHSSDTLLNQIWDLSKYTIKSTSFLGIYIDGDRERIPYEADALINQLSHYCVARNYSMARYSYEYLIHRPTWPTEWIMQSVLMAWEDYIYTGNTLSLEHFYDDLKAKTLTALTDENGFISTRTGKVTEEVLESIHFKGQLRDIVDWPHTGILGLEKEEGGETDGFVFTDINTVVNAYHYRTLTLMANIAETLGKNDDQKFYTGQAAKLKKSFNNRLFDRKRGIYIDGIGTDHASLHANMFPLAFGLVPEKNINSVLEFIRSRKMACSVYGSQFLLDAIYNSHDAEYGLELLTSTSERSWYNMIRVGSTMTLEAWDNKYKPNQDWNHAWGAAPANLIPRKLMGIEPLEPGFRKIRIKPQPASLESAEIKHPTIRGDIMVKFTNKPDESFRLEVIIPGNTTAEVYLPFYSAKQKIHVGNQPVAYRRQGDFSVIEDIGSGKWVFTVEH
jgi:Bacterial alpha-L-rhamnosidase.